MIPSYHTTRFQSDPRRDLLWKTLCDAFFNRLVQPTDCVIDLGCGYGGFINHIHAVKRIALDNWPDFRTYIRSGIKTVVGSLTDLAFLEEKSVDFAFASNVFEHVSKEDFATCLQTLRPKLSERGTINILQPNYRYCASEYFDDYTHISIFSHISIADFLKVNGYEIFDLRPRFMPLSVANTRMPVLPSLIRLYLWSPIKPLGKQMLVRARALRARH